MQGQEQWMELGMGTEDLWAESTEGAVKALALPAQSKWRHVVRSHGIF